MEDKMKMVERFSRQIIGLPIPSTPTLPSAARLAWFFSADDEERTEINDAWMERSVVGFVDGCLDKAYFALGRVLECGFPVGAGFEAVHEANMAKERGEQAKRPGSMGYDAVKPNDWTGPEKTLEALATLTLDDCRKALELKQKHPREWEQPAASIAFRAREYLTHREAIDFKRRYGSISPEKLNSLLLDEEMYSWPAEAEETASVLSDRISPTPDPVKTGQELVWHSIKPSPAVSISALHVRRRKKIVVIGWARHGKDTVAEILQRAYGLSFESSSRFCAERVVMPWVKEQWRKYYEDPLGREQYQPVMDDYATAEECFQDRVNHRADWRKLIEEYVHQDPTKLGCEILQRHDVYVGVRMPRELHALRNAGAFDVCVWVDASGRGVPPEPEDSCKVQPWMADYVIDNSRGVEELEVEVRRLFDRIGVDAF